MSGILIVIAFALGLAAAFALMAYGKGSSRRPGGVKPERPPTAEERRRGEGK